MKIGPKKLENFNFFIKYEDGKILKNETEKDGTVTTINWKTVVNPDQKFIDAINLALGTNFTIEAFKS